MNNNLNLILNKNCLNNGGMITWWRKLGVLDNYF